MAVSRRKKRENVWGLLSFGVDFLVDKYKEMELLFEEFAPHALKLVDNVRRRVYVPQSNEESIDSLLLHTFVCEQNQLPTTYPEFSNVAVRVVSIDVVCLELCEISFEVEWSTLCRRRVSRAFKGLYASESCSSSSG